MGLIAVGECGILNMDLYTNATDRETGFMEKKRILLIHNFYQIGGGEHTVFENEKQLLEVQGHKVFAYTRSNLELKGAPWKLLRVPFATVWSFRTFFAIRRLIKEKGIDVVHCHNTFPLISPSCYYAARSRKVPVVQTVHNFRFACPNGLCFRDGSVCEDCLAGNSLKPAGKHGCYRGSRVQTAPVVAMLKLHRRLGTYRKIHYIFLTEFNRQKLLPHLGVPLEQTHLKPNFVRRPETPFQSASGKRFVYAGRLDENKGIGFLLKAWEALPEDYILHIYGDGPYKDACLEASRRMGNIRFFGFRPREEIFGDLGSAVGLVFPSTWYEGFPMVLAESFSLGRGILCADLGNHGDLVRSSGGGVCYTPGDVDSFVRGAMALAEQPGVYGERAENYYRDRLSPEKNYEMLCDIYDKAEYVP